MTPCWQCREPGRPYKSALGHREKVWCDACAASAMSLGVSLTLVERRVTDIPVTRERRHFGKPRWLAHLRAKDMTGAAA